MSCEWPTTSSGLACRSDGADFETESGSDGSRSRSVSRADSGPGRGVLEGRKALDVTVEHLCRELCANDVTAKLFIGEAERRRLAADLCSFLAGAFGGADWPPMRVESRLIDGLVTDLVPFLCRESLQQHESCGSDVLGSAISDLQSKLVDDLHALRIFNRIQGAALPTVAKHHESVQYSVETRPSLGNRAPVGPTSGPIPRTFDKQKSMPLDEEVDSFENEIDVLNFGELQMDASIVQAAMRAWSVFAKGDSVGESIFVALFAVAPALEDLFKASPSVHAMRFMTAMNACFKSLDDRATLKALVETLAFGHMHFPITVEDVIVFRTAITDLMSLELGDVFLIEARQGVTKLLNYIGGAIIHIKSQCTERVRILLSSWQKANNKEVNTKLFLGLDGQEDDEEQLRSGSKGEVNEESGSQKKTMRGRMKNMMRRGSADASTEQVQVAKKKKKKQKEEEEEKEEAEVTAKKKHTGRDRDGNVQYVPTTYPEMFRFNAAVMGFGNSFWMAEVLACFDDVVMSASDCRRLTSECEVLGLRIAKVTSQQINLAEFKACMLASLRSLLPKEWGPPHEVAWNWFWDNVQRRITATLKVSSTYGKDVKDFFASLDEDSRYEVRTNIYIAFFAAAPSGQDYFKQSNTRLHFISELVFKMISDIFDEPARMVDAISAVGLRHVGYGIPTEIFPAFVSAHIEVFQGHGCDARALDAFKWSFGLIMMMVVRTINEGSTLVMKAINVNSKEKIKNAIADAPRGDRSSQMLQVQVGSQSISPLEWAIESGRLAAAEAIIQDLLTFRADRERYYYGMERLFGQHPDIVKMLCTSAPSLLPALLDGLVWRSRSTVAGVRRANYYVKYMVVRHDGGVSDALSWFAVSGDCDIISHPVNVLVSDTMWKGIVRKHFLVGRVWFLFCLVVFLVSQAILPKWSMNDDDTHYIRVIIFALRIITYLGSLPRLIYNHFSKIIIAYRKRDLMYIGGCIPVPSYLQEMYDLGSFFLMSLLIAIFSTEAMLSCLEEPGFPRDSCAASLDTEWYYRVLSMIAMGMHWLLIVDLSVFSTKTSAFVLVCTTVLAEVGRFLLALIFLLFTFGSAIACLKRDHPDWHDVPTSVLSLFAVTLLMMPRDYRELQYDPALLLPVFVFVTASVIMLLNLLIAQLNCSYEFIYADMVGFARLNRANVIVESLETCSAGRWAKFVLSLKLNVRLEFNEGDVGIAGAIVMNEPASMNPVMTEQILRYGGECSPEMPWPEEHSSSDRLERMERIVTKLLKKLDTNAGPTGEQRQVSGAARQTSGASASASDTASVTDMEL